MLRLTAYCLAWFGFVVAIFGVPVAAARELTTAPGWAGFYVGGHAGYALGNNRYDLEGVSLDVTTGDFIGSRGFSGGVLAGYNVPLTRRWVAGLEADVSAQNIETSLRYFETSYVASLRATQNWSVSIRGRLGYLAAPRTLIYATAGWAISKVDLKVELSGSDDVTDSNVINGIQAGIGAETAVAPRWLARVEYLHTLYGETRFSDATVTNAGTRGIRPMVGLGRIAAIYQLGEGGTQAPFASVVPQWTGCYLGGSIGVGTAYADIATGDTRHAADLKGVGLSGPVPTVFAGFNYRIAPRWIVGMEGEIAPSVRSTDLKLGWIGAVRARFGYLLMPDTLVYATAGWAGTYVEDLMYKNVVAVAGQMLNGPQFGGGIETAFAENWNLRLDYQYGMIRTVDLSFPSVVPSNQLPARASPQGQMGRVAIVRLFGG
jgi:outer membrane immunogenic protein